MKPAEIQTPEQSQDAIQRLAKWRAHFAGWLLGTRAKSDPQSEWARDNTEKLIIMRAEINALTRLLMDAKIITPEGFTIQMGQEAQALSNAFEERWPGVIATDDGLSYDPVRIVSAGWMKNWLP